MSRERIYKNDVARQILATGIIPNDTVTKCHEFRESSEKNFQSWVIKEAEKRGWRVYHTYDSRRCAAGFPDLEMIRINIEKNSYRHIHAELKTMTGKLSKDQQEWIDGLGMVKSEVYVWRPSDMDEILRVLE